MNDPTRLDEVLRAVKGAWAGQPDLSLPTLMAMASTQGIGWGSSDDELVDYLAELAQQYPAELKPGDLADGSGYMLSLMDNAMSISLIDAHVIVHTPHRKQTVVWKFASFRTMSPGFPLVSTDGEGIDHRLGVIERIIRMDIQQKRESLQGLTRAEIGDVVHVVTTDDGTTIRLSRRVDIVAAARRSLEVESQQWTRVVQHSPLVIELAGGTTMNLGTPATVLLAAT